MKSASREAVSLCLFCCMGDKMWAPHWPWIVAVGLGDWRIGVWFPAGTDFSYLHSVQTGPGAHPASFWMDTGIKQPGHEAGHLPHLVPKLRMRGAIPPLPVRLYGMVLTSSDGQLLPWRVLQHAVSTATAIEPLTGSLKLKNETPWVWSASELCRSSDRRLLAK
jgi:hypothetical protein